MVGDLLLAGYRGMGRWVIRWEILPYDDCLPLECASMVMILIPLFTFVWASPRYRYDVCYIIRAVLLEGLARSELLEQDREE